jgi:serine/threonine protein kinase
MGGPLKKEFHEAQYEELYTIGSGTYGVVLKCRHRESEEIVAIKRFKEGENDEQVFLSHSLTYLE